MNGQKVSVDVFALSHSASDAIMTPDGIRTRNLASLRR